MVEVAGQRAYAAHVAVIPPAVHLKLSYLAKEHIPEKVGIPPAVCVLDEVFEGGLLHHDHVAGGMGRCGLVWVELYAGHPAVLRQIEAQLVELVVRVMYADFIIHEGYVSPGAYVLGYHIVEGGIEYGVAAGDYYVLLGAAPYVAHHGMVCVYGTPVYAGIVSGHEGRQYEQAVPLPVQLPFLAGAQMIHQRVVVLLGNYANVGNARVHKVAHYKVYAAVSARKGHRGNRP